MYQQHESHHERDDLAHEHPFTDRGQLIAIVIYIILLILDNVFNWVPTIYYLFPWFIALILGCPFLILGAYFGINAHKIVFGETRNPPRVITQGVFQYSRNPMYLGSIYFFIGFAIINLSLIGLIYCIGVFFFYNHVVKYEEKRLLDKFGEEYQKYMQKVARWIF